MQHLEDQYVRADRFQQGLALALVIPARIGVGIVWAIVAVCLFLGQPIPVVGWDPERSLLLFLLWLFLGGPLLFFLVGLVIRVLVVVVGVPIAMMMTRGARHAGITKPYYY